ncbi:hypothetical protein [Bauldia sp.]|uniref:hypothetical protein n=1 Tax=Bauldia sp. TaxID=2575872 RepID=UPI003BA8975F
MAVRHGGGLALPKTGAILVLAGAAFVVATVAASAAEVPLPRISPLKLQAEAAAPADPALGPPRPDGSEPVDTALIPPSSANGQPIKAFDASAFAADRPLGLAPLDLSAPAEPTPFDLLPGDGPIDLSGTGRSDTPGVLGTVTIFAKMTEDSRPLQSGMMWRVFDANPLPDGKLRLVGEADGGPVTLKLRPGRYMVHAAYGRAGYTREVRVTEAPSTEEIVLNAGGLRLGAMVGEDRPLAATDVSFDIYASDESGPAERVLLMKDAPASKVISLNAGIYHIVCRYGDANAMVRADIRVEPGKLTEASVHQQAARLTLKLVSEQGGEALANTSWSVMTPAGESVVESVGAFPSVVLAAGEYTAIAKNGERIFERTFTVEPGLDRDIEVLLADAQ